VRKIVDVRERVSIGRKERIARGKYYRNHKNYQPLSKTIPMHIPVVAGRTSCFLICTRIKNAHASFGETITQSMGKYVALIILFDSLCC
jgi:hypothetical protein